MGEAEGEAVEAEGEAKERRGQVVAGGGVLLRALLLRALLLRALLPRPGHLDGTPEAYVLNVWTDPDGPDPRPATCRTYIP